MAKYLVKRLLITLPIFLLITFFVFLLTDMVPGSPVDLLNESGELTPEAYAELEHALGLDRPFLVRYASWLGDMLRGDMGVSNRTKQPVADMIGERIGPSLTLTLSGLLLAVLISIPLGTMSACKPYSLWDKPVLGGGLYRHLGARLFPVPAGHLSVFGQAGVAARLGHV